MSHIVRVDEYTGPGAMMMLSSGRSFLIDFAYSVGVMSLLNKMTVADLAEFNEQFQIRESARRSNNEWRGYTVDKQGRAVIDFNGVMTKRPTCMGMFLGGDASTMQLIETLKAADADPDVKQRWVDMETPGGDAFGAFNAADYIYSQRKSAKPIYVYGQDQVTSGGILLASQANGFFGNTNIVSGSVGVMTTIVDSSMAAQQRGIKVILVKAGEHKGGAVSGVPVSEQAVANIQKRVDSYHGLFKTAVSRGTGLKGEDLAKVSDASVFVGNEGVKVGLIDQLASSIEEAMSIVDGGFKRQTNTKKVYPVAKPTATAPTQASETDADIELTDNLSEAATLLGEDPTVLVTDTQDPPAPTQSATGTNISYVVGGTTYSASVTEVVSMLQAAGITSLESAQAIRVEANDGAQYLSNVKDSAKKFAILAHGADAGAALAADIDKMSLKDGLSAIGTYKTLAKSQRLSGDQAPRQTAPSPMPGAAPTNAPSQSNTGTKPQLAELVAAARQDMADQGII